MLNSYGYKDKRSFKESELLDNINNRTIKYKKLNHSMIWSFHGDYVQ
jgi:hypothetical protein